MKYRKDEGPLREDSPQYADDSLSKFGMMHSLVDDLDSKLHIQQPPTGKK